MQFSTLFVVFSTASLGTTMAIPTLSSLPGLRLLARQSVSRT